MPLCWCRRKQFFKSGRMNMCAPASTRRSITISNTFSFVPIFFAAAMADLFGVAQVLLIVAVLVTAFWCVRVAPSPGCRTIALERDAQLGTGRDRKRSYT